MADDFVFPTFGEEKPKAKDKPKASAKPAAVIKAETDDGFVLPKFPQSPMKESNRKAMSDGIMAPGPASMLRGATFGLSDKALAAGKSLIDNQDLSDYEKNVGKQFRQRDAYNEENPIGHYIDEGLGGLVTGGTISQGVKAAGRMVAPQLSKAKGVLPKLGKLAGLVGGGAAAGGIAGAGQAEVGAEAQGLQDGAVAGAIAAPVVKGGMKAVGTALRPLTPMVANIMKTAGITKPDDWASQKYVQKLLEDGETPESIVRKLRTLSMEGTTRPDGSTIARGQGKPVVMADVLPLQSQKFLGSASRKEGPGQGIINRKLGAREAEGSQRLQNDITTGIAPNVGYRAEVDRLVQERSQLSKPLYDRAMAVGTVNDPDIDKYFSGSPLRQQWFRMAESSAKSNKEPFRTRMRVAPNGSLVNVIQPDIASLHLIKQHIDKQRSSLWNPDRGRFEGVVKESGGQFDASDLRKHRDELVKIIEKLTPDGNGGSTYGAARKIFSDQSDMIEAVENGARVMRDTPETIDRAYKGLKNDWERAAFRSGVAYDLSKKVNGDVSQRAALKAIDKPSMQQKLSTVFETPDHEQYWRKSMAAEKAMNTTDEALLPNTSASGFNIGDGGRREGSLGVAVANAAARRPVAAIGNAMNFLTGRLEAQSGEFAEPVARIGMSGVDEAAAWAKRLRDAKSTPMGMVKRGAGALSRVANDGLPLGAAAVAGADTQQEDQFGDLGSGLPSWEEIQQRMALE